MIKFAVSAVGAVIIGTFTMAILKAASIDDERYGRD